MNFNIIPTGCTPVNDSLHDALERLHSRAAEAPRYAEGARLLTVECGIARTYPANAFSLCLKIAGRWYEVASVQPGDPALDEVQLKRYGVNDVAETEKKREQERARRAEAERRADAQRHLEQVEYAIEHHSSRSWSAGVMQQMRARAAELRKRLGA